MTSQQNFIRRLKLYCRFYKDFTIFWVVLWVQVQYVWLALGMALNFLKSVTNGLKLKVRKFLGLIPTFVKATGEKLVEMEEWGDAFWWGASRSFNFMQKTEKFWYNNSLVVLSVLTNQGRIRNSVDGTFCKSSSTKRSILNVSLGSEYASANQTTKGSTEKHNFSGYPRLTKVIKILTNTIQLLSTSVTFFTHLLR